MNSYAFNRGWLLKIIKCSEMFMTFRKEINQISSILYSLILGRQIAVVSCTVKQVDEVLENFPTSSMSCRSCHAWGVDVDFLLIKLFFLFSNNYFLLERRQATFQECLQCADNKYHSLKVKRREQNSKVLLSGCSAKMLLI